MEETQELAKGTALSSEKSGMGQVRETQQVLRGSVGDLVISEQGS